MTNNIGKMYGDTTTQQTGYLGWKELTRGANDYVPLSPEGLLIFCQTQLRAIDENIQKKMNGQQNLVALEGQLSVIQSQLKDLASGKPDGTAFNDPNAIKALDEKFVIAISNANASGNKELAANLQHAQDILHAHGDNEVSKDEVKDICNILDSSTSSLRSGAELSMIELQSLVSKRATQLQLTTGMMNSIDEGAKAIAGNVGR